MHVIRTPCLYDSDDGIVATAFRWSSTILPASTESTEFWFYFFVNLGLHIVYRVGWFDPRNYDVDLPWGLTGTMSSLLTFFVVLYNSNAFGRYQQLFDVCKELFGAVLEFTSMVKGRLGSIPHQRRATRYMLASCYIFLLEREGPGITEVEWAMLYDLGLLSWVEIDALDLHASDKQVEGGQAFIVMHWSLEVVRDAVPEWLQRDDMMSAFFDKAFQIRSCQALTKNLIAMRIPFQYFHIMTFMLTVNLFFWGYSLAFMDTYWALSTFFFIQLIFIGLRELCAALANPFGTEDVDFPVNVWLDNLTWRVAELLEGSFDPTAQVRSERPLPLPKSGAVDLVADEHHDEVDLEGSLPQTFICTVVVSMAVVWCAIQFCLDPSFTLRSDPDLKPVTGNVWPGLRDPIDVARTTTLAPEKSSGHGDSDRLSEEEQAAALAQEAGCRGEGETSYSAMGHCAPCCPGLRPYKLTGEYVKEHPDVLLVSRYADGSFMCFRSEQKCTEVTDGWCGRWSDPCGNQDELNPKCSDRGRDMWISGQCLPCCNGMQWMLAQEDDKWRYRCFWDKSDCLGSADSCKTPDDFIRPCSCCPEVEEDSSSMDLSIGSSAGFFPR